MATQQSRNTLDGIRLQEISPEAFYEPGKRSKEYLWPPEGNIDICPKGNKTSFAPVGNGSLSVSTSGQILCRYSLRVHDIKIPPRTRVRLLIRFEAEVLKFQFVSF